MERKGGGTVGQVHRRHDGQSLSEGKHHQSCSNQCVGEGTQVATHSELAQHVDQGDVDAEEAVASDYEEASVCDVDAEKAVASGELDGACENACEGDVDAVEAVASNECGIRPAPNISILPGVSRLTS